LLSTTLWDGLREGWLAPFHLRLSRNRVADEHAPVTILAPEHPVLTTPNRITAADFRGLGAGARSLLPRSVDERFTAILASGDADETPAQGRPAGGAARQGYFVYTSLAWFRQLPKQSPARIGCSRISSRLGK